MKYGTIALLAVIILVGCATAQADSFPVIADGVQGWAWVDEVAPYQFDARIELENGTAVEAVNKDLPDARVTVQFPEYVQARETGSDAPARVLLVTNPVRPEDEMAVLSQARGHYDMVILFRTDGDVVPADPLSTDCDLSDCALAAAHGCSALGSRVKKMDYQAGKRCMYECENGAVGSADCAKVTAKGNDLQAQTN